MDYDRIEKMIEEASDKRRSKQEELIARRILGDRPLEINKKAKGSIEVDG